MTFFVYSKIFAKLFPQHNYSRLELTQLRNWKQQLKTNTIIDSNIYSAI